MEKEHENENEDSEIRVWKHSLIGALIFAFPLVILMLLDRFFLINIFGNGTGYMTYITLLMLALAFPVIFIFGWQTIKSGLRGFVTFYFSMDSLIALGTIIAYLTGITSLFFNVQDYSGISAMIMTIFITGKYIEAKAKGKATSEIMKLIQLGAKKARILKGNKEIEISIEDLKIGDVMIIKPGEKIPTDGLVVKGESAVDESMVTGESMPRDKTKGFSVIGATINQDGILYVKATKVGSDTFLAHIIQLVESAQSEKIPIQKLADKITNVFVPIILILSFLSGLIWFIFTGDISLAIGIAVAVLVIACPCSLGLAVPIVIMVSSGMGAKQGILIRKGEAIQTMKEIRYIVFDKTGTITKGKPEVTNVYSLVSEKYLLTIAASLEKLSENPIALAIVKKAQLKEYKKVKNFKISRGRGLEGTMGKNIIVIGNSVLMKEKGISLAKVKDKIKDFESNGNTTLIVSENNKVIGIIAVSDSLKEDSIEAIGKLNSLGYRTVMITGDNELAAGAIAKQVGISEVIANVLPEDKAKRVERLQKKGMVAFVGDGINDAPALKQANVSIAMGTGTDIAIESGDIVLANGSLSGVVHAISLSKATFKKIKQNLFWAFGYNIIAIPLAVAGVLHPIIAELAMALSSITVVTNANLLRRKEI